MKNSAIWWCAGIEAVCYTPVSRRQSRGICHVTRAPTTNPETTQWDKVRLPERRERERAGTFCKLLTCRWWCLSDMESCRIPHRVLLLFILRFITVHVSAETIVRGKFNQSAVLPCKWSCSGLAKWTLFSFSTDILAECDQTSCQSLEEGFNMSHDQYLKGDLNLTITAADHNKRDLYTCHCGDTAIGDVRLTIDTVTSSAQMNPGEDLLLELYAFDSLELIYKNKDSADGKQICTVIKSSLHCTNAEYRPRISLANAVLKLRGVKPSDEGVYTIHETDTREDLLVYKLSVRDTDQNSVQKRPLPKWVSILIVVVVLVVLLFGALLGIILHQRKQIKYYQGALVLSDETDVEMSKLTMNE